jgi:pyruvate/2-oxoglutarate/acetoin dehydrogenase E1 component
MAIRGMRPVIEIMFGDFITLCTDQILNGATKFTTMYGKALEVPLLIRTPMGGGRGYGPTHSQSIEKMFLGIPNLTVVSPSLGHNPGNLLRQSIENITNPLLFVEYKSLYPKKLISSDEIINICEVENPEKHPVVLAKNFTSGEPDVIVITYGGGSEQLFEVMRSLAIDEIRIEGVLPSRIDLKGEPPWWFDLIKTDKPIIVAEHGTPGTTWGTEITSLLYESFFSTLTMPIRRLSSADEVIPAKVSLESNMMLTSEKLSQAVIEMLG